MLILVTHFTSIMHKEDTETDKNKNTDAAIIMFNFELSKIAVQ